MTPKQRAAAYTAYSRQRTENIGAILCEYRKRRKLTDRTIASAAGINFYTYQHRKANPETFRLFELWRLCEVLGVPEEERKTII